MSDPEEPSEAFHPAFERLSSTSSNLSSLPSILGDGEEGGGEDVSSTLWAASTGWDINWQERCFELEMSLHKFRQQAFKIRDILKDKLVQLEGRVDDAERRAEEAEKKAQLMEQRLAGESRRGGQPFDASSATNAEFNSPHHTRLDKDSVISTLEQQVEEQKRLRICDAKQVEDKAAKIKEWVTNKLKELEEQNQHLREQNQKCNVQLELLRNRLTQLAQLNTKQKTKQKRTDRASTEDSSRGSFEERAESDDNLPAEAPNRSAQAVISRVRRERSMGEESNSMRSEVTLRTKDSTFRDSGSDPLYAAVDYSKKKSHTRSAPPRVKPERKIYTSRTSTVSSASELCDSEMDSWPGSKVDSGSIDVDTPALITPKSPLTPSCAASAPQSPFSHTCACFNQLPTEEVETLPPVPSHMSSSCACGGATAPDTGKKPPLSHIHSKIATMKLNEDKAFSSGVASARSVSPAGSLVKCQQMDHWSGVSKHQESSTPSGSTYSSLSSKLSAHKDLVLGELGSTYASSCEGKTGDDEIHDYAEIYTPNKELPDFGRQRSLPEETDYVGAKPPTPPLHRFPSWESKIYEVAVNGINISCESMQGHPTGSPNNNTKLSADYYSNAAFTSLNIPVYATVKGRASQIRSVPFTGDSSDSSDNEDTRVTVTSTSSHTTSGDTESSLSTGSPGKKGSTTLSPIPSQQGCSSPTKSVRRDTSVESVLSDDYAIPPDAISADTISLNSVDPATIRTPHPEETPKKNDVNRKPQGQIILDDVCRVNRAEGAATFEISTGKRTYYLTADSISTMEEWIKVLQNVLRRNATRLLLSKEDHKPTVEGWLTKVKHGHSRRCWCVLIGRMFLYFKTPNDAAPLGQINMRDSRVEEVVHVSDSDEDDQDERMSKSEYTVGIFPNHQGPTYLLMSSKQEMDAWMYHLTVVSSGDNLVGTQYEQLIARLMEVNGDENSVLWRHPLLLYTKENITQPLTSLPSEQLQTEAIKLFKSIQLFISVPLDTSGIDYHVSLAQNALQQCLIFPELQNELFCQLTKQTSRHCHQKLGVQQLLLCATQSLFLCDTSSSEKVSPSSTGGPEKPPPPENKLNPAPYVFVQAWQLLALAVSLFVPKNRTLWYLKSHLQKNSDSKLEAGKYAIFCQRALERALANGGRECKPSRMEVLSILLKNPYHHSLPHSIPVHFVNGSYQVFGFDGSTTVGKFVQTVNTEVGIRDSVQSGFALFSDDPIEKSLEHCLQNDAKLCDVISQWEQALREKHLGKFENTKVLRLMYKNRLCLRQMLKAETEKERLLTVYQVNEEIVQGRFPLTKELALELAALLAQIEFGDYNGEKFHGCGTPANSQHHLQLVVEKFFPQRYQDVTRDKQAQGLIKEKWMALKSRSIVDCVRIYLNCARKWSYCGGKLFSAKLKTRELQTVWLAVTEDSIALLDSISMQCLVRYSYASIMTFGGCKEDFMLVVSCQEPANLHDGPSPTERLLFAMPKPKILEITLLIADYMNALGKAQTAPPSPQASTLSRLEKIRAKIRGTSLSTSTNESVVTSHAPMSSMCTVDSPDIVKMAAAADSRLLHRCDSKNRSECT